MNDIIALDKRLLLFLNGLGSESFDRFWLLVSGTVTWTPFYLLLLLFLYRKVGPKKLLVILAFVALGVVISDQASNLFKYGFQRLRPCHDESIIPKMRRVTCSGLYGFYSAHASICFFVAGFLNTLLAERCRWVPFVLFPWAILISYSRIYLGVHFPGDVLVGAMMGYATGYFLSIPTSFLSRKLERSGCSGGSPDLP